MMTHPFIADPKYWRERAIEARSIAKLLDEAQARQELLAIAAGYDRLAESISQHQQDTKSSN